MEDSDIYTMYIVESGIIDSNILLAGKSLNISKDQIEVGTFSELLAIPSA